MPRVVNSVRIDGAVEQVFDLVTTTKYWPQWHPATVGVGGVTERPIALGDVIHERARIGGRTCCRPAAGSFRSAMRSARWAPRLSSSAPWNTIQKTSPRP